MARLLVSVRSVSEALAAVAGGASLIDIKEPDLGPLGRADASTWRAIRAAVPPAIPVSLALGEWPELPGRLEIPPGIAFVKVGLAGVGERPPEAWPPSFRDAPPRVAVVYLDHERADSPAPDAILRRALDDPQVAGVLVDTFDKTRRTGLGPGWGDRIRAIHAAGRFVALAGGLDVREITRLAPLGPDWFAVRGAACLGGDRGGTVDAERVARLVRAAETRPDRPDPAGVAVEP